MQRLAEDRFRQEWLTFKADEQKRWANFQLTYEEQQQDILRRLDTHQNQLTAHEDLLVQIKDDLSMLQEQTQKRRTHPDRLKEEREREMSIDLGFAYLTLPGGMEVGIVDVPGHRDFIANMLAGVGGVDAVLLVVAADEGVMPQTREHVDILDLLGVSTGLVALTKIDLVDDEEWLDLVEDEVRALLQPTSLAQAPPKRPDLGRPRLPIDRAFTLVGFGTVVTGTLMDGSFSLGEEVEILPQGLRIARPVAWTCIYASCLKPRCPFATISGSNCTCGPRRSWPGCACWGPRRWLPGLQGGPSWNYESPLW